jgi:integrase
VDRAGEKSKTGEPLQVKLIPEAVSLLKERHAELGGLGYVFPSTRYNTADHVASPWHKWDEVRRRADIDAVKMHDFGARLAVY